MADAVEVLDHRHPGLCADALDQALAAAGHDHVHILGHGDQPTHRRPIRRVDHLHRGFRQARRPQAHGQAFGDGAVGGQRLGPAPQDSGVAGLEAEARRLHGHIGPGLINDADDAEGHTHPADLDSAGHGVHVGNGTHRVGEAGDLAQALQHGVDTRRGEFQAIHQRGRKAGGGAARQVLRIGLGQPGPGPVQRVQGCQQRLVAGGGGGRGDPSGCGPGRPAKLCHVLIDIHE